MEKFRTIFFRIIGIMFLLTGAFLLVTSFERIIHEFRLVVLVLFHLLFGILLTSQANRIAASFPKQTVLQKTINRRILLFNLFLIVYLITAAYVAVSAELHGRDMRMVMIYEAISFAAVIGAYIYLLSQIITQKKNTRIQDPLIGAQPIFEQNTEFAFLSKEAHPEKDSYLVGTLRGPVKAGDTAWLLHLGFIQKTEVTAIEYTASSTIIHVKDLPETDYNDFILTSRIPYHFHHGVNAEIPVANAELSALLTIHHGKSIPHEIIARLCWLLSHSTFLVRVSPKDNTDTFAKKLNQWLFGYSGLYNAGTVSREDDSETLYAVYTDWDAFTRMQKSPDSQSTEHDLAMILTFQQILTVLQEMKVGLVINPFGPDSFSFPYPVLDEIRHLDWYRREFEKKEQS
ncbi:MAG: SseB family protein [Solobacterium sp.]|nr:SseB family protein [Solobacterium sp.]